MLHISITITWRHTDSPHEMVASVTINKLTSSLQEDDANYDARFAPDVPILDVGRTFQAIIILVWLAEIPQST